MWHANAAHPGRCHPGPSKRTLACQVQHPPHLCEGQKNMGRRQGAYLVNFLVLKCWQMTCHLSAPQHAIAALLQQAAACCQCSPLPVLRAPTIPATCVPAATQRRVQVSCMFAPCCCCGSHANTCVLAVTPHVLQVAQPPCGINSRAAAYKAQPYIWQCLC
jgi:hypothetical protein